MIKMGSFKTGLKEFKNLRKFRCECQKGWLPIDDVDEIELPTSLEEVYLENEISPPDAFTEGM